MKCAVCRCDNHGCTKTYCRVYERDTNCARCGEPVTNDCTSFGPWRGPVYHRKCAAVEERAKYTLQPNN